MKPGPEEACVGCGVRMGALPYDWSGRPKLWGCFDCEPVVLLCEDCMAGHRRELHGEGE